MAVSTTQCKQLLQMTKGQIEDINKSNVRCWRWVVALGSFWMNFCLLGVQRSNGILFVALLENFGASREDAAWPVGILGFCMCFTGLLSGFLSHHFSNRYIMLVGAFVASAAVSLCYWAEDITTVAVLYGAFQGAGLGAIVPLSHVVINQHFTDHRALAMGIAYAGSSAGSFVFPAVSHWMIGEFGLSGTFLLLGGIMLNSLLGISLFRRIVTEKDSKISRNSNSYVKQKKFYDTKKIFCETPEACKRKKFLVHDDDSERSKQQKISVCDKLHCEEKNSDACSSRRIDPVLQTDRNLSTSYKLTVQILARPTFFILSISFAVYFSISAIFLMVILDFGVDRGLPTQKGVFLVSIFSFGDLAGRLGCGWITDLQCIRRKPLVSCYLIMMGILMMVIPTCSSYEALVTVALLLGILNGSVIVNYSVIFTETFGLQKLPLAIGFSSCIIGLSAFLRSIVIGYFRDKHQEYNLLFQYLGAVQIFMICIWFLESLAKRIHKLLLQPR